MPRKSSSTAAAAVPTPSETADKSLNCKRKIKPVLAMPLKSGHHIDAKDHITADPVRSPEAPSVIKASKQDTISNLLRQPEGAIVNQLMEAFGWQAHSIRGFLSGTFRKKLDISLVSETIV